MKRPFEEMFDEMFARAETRAAEIAAGAPRTPACLCQPVNCHEVTLTETIPYGDGNDTFLVDVPVVTCLTCGAGFTDERAEGLRDAGARAIGLRLMGDA